MAEPIYLNYADQQVNQQDFLNAVSNNVTNYVNSQPWSSKRKESFMKAYQDIMNKGVRGANNSTGQWMINVGGDNIDFDSMKKRDREMYQEAAYFIQQQMNGLANNKKEEKKEDKKLQLFDNDFVTTNLHNYISDTRFGGIRDDLTSRWNQFDAPTRGIRGITNRKAKLIEDLQNWGDRLKAEDYNFEGSPFRDFNDFNTRRLAAIEALRNTGDTINDNARDALFQLGLDPEHYFSTGANNTVTLTDGRQLTQQEYNDLQDQQEQEELAAKQQKQEKQSKDKQHIQSKDKQHIQTIRQNINRFKQIYYYNHDKPYGILEFSRISEINSEDDILPYIRRLLEKINDNVSYRKVGNVIHGGYKWANSKNKLKRISDTIYNILQRTQLGRSSKTPRLFLRQLEGVDNIVYDSFTDKIIFLDENKKKTKTKEDSIQRQKITNIKQRYSTLNTPTGSVPFYPYYNKQGGQINNNLDKKTISDFINNLK